MKQALIRFALLSWCFLSWPASAEQNAASPKPIDIPLVKLEYPGQPFNIRMLYIPIVDVGSRRVNYPILFDTASSGMTIDCDLVLPKKLCSSEGIKIEKEQTIDGVRVTTEKVKMTYGRHDEYGNLAFATVSIGSRKSPTKTKSELAFVIRYKTVDRQSGKTVVGYLWPKGTFGVSPIGGFGSSQTARSPIWSFEPPVGLARGFVLSPIGTSWKICTNEKRDCPSAPLLHIGVGGATKASFETAKWKSADPRYNFPTVTSCISWLAEMACKPTVYDTGNSIILVSLPSDGKSRQPLEKGVGVNVFSEGHSPWSFKTTYKPEVEFSLSRGHHIVGIRYFELNSLLMDFDSEEIGFRING